jgi:hypothetical protein
VKTEQVEMFIRAIDRFTAGMQTVADSLVILARTSAPFAPAMGRRSRGRQCALPTFMLRRRSRGPRGLLSA